MADTVAYRLTHVRQSSENDCWAAAVAMILGRSVGPGSAKLDPSGGLLSTGANLRAFAASHNLRILPSAKSWTGPALAEILTLGPVLAIGNYSTTVSHSPKRGDTLWRLAAGFGYPDPPEFIREFCRLNPSVKDPNLIIAGRTYTVPRMWAHATVIAGIRNGTDILLQDPAEPGPAWVNYSRFMSRYPKAAPVMMQQKRPF